MNPIDFFNKLHENKKRLDDEDVINEELNSLYQEFVMECHEQEHSFSLEYFRECFNELMKINHEKIYNEYYINSYINDFLKEKASEKFWGDL